MNIFLVRVATGRYRLSVHAIGASSTEALLRVLSSLEAAGLSVSSGVACRIGRVA